MVAGSALAGGALLLTGGGIARAAVREQVREQAREQAADAVALRLPAPTGPHPVGATTLYLVDPSRRDPWDPSLPVREVMVTVLYPAAQADGDGCPIAPQMTPGTASVFAQVAPLTNPQLPNAGVDWAATMTHAHAGAPAQAVRRPVVIYSPGGGDPRTLGTYVAEELASQGHVVVSIDHPGDAGAVQFPVTTSYRSECIRTTVFRENPRTRPDVYRTAIAARLADIRFVLNQLELLAAGRNPDAADRPLPQHLPRALDLARVGIYGHSAGGTAAAQAAYDDRRIRAVVNLEGYLDYPPDQPGEPGPLFPVARYGVNRPMLLLGTDGFRNADIDRSWSAMLAHPNRRTSRRQIDDAMHWVFSDFAAMVPQLQADGLMTAEGRDQMVGALGPGCSVAMVREYVLAFFERNLSGT
ncbi:alpha/beta hydrolase family protein [Streptomyces alanosinicus]|uniref:Esterase n=1 Tax=Streptomyces alanosinicus TaxID=68171 RepID=A0A919D827_9ACTN|nr:alpha/beta hydrolase [Streptomyces alanosinicus]GHE15434.1 esterase [Streptomyces alanosinicus]